MAVNKVVKSDGTTVIDLTSDTVTNASHIMAGYFGHLANGVRVEGTGESGPSATRHTLLFEYTDESSETVYTYYDDALIGTAITATIPTEHGGKEVQTASLDGVEWYAKPTYQFETLFNDRVAYWPDDNSDYPYCWITALGETTIPEGSTWRVTFDGAEYLLTGFTQAGHNYGVIGNPKWGGLEDNGVDAPFYFYGPFYGAWSGGANVADGSDHMVKIERAITT